jgi:orotate phosphoribosyltransferase
MNEEQVLEEFRQAGALLEGHFVLSSGLHSARYLQCARVMMDARRADRLCSALKQKIAATISDDIEMVASPAMGGVVVGYEMGRQFGVPSVFLERVDGQLALRRGFAIEPGTKCLMAEDIVTTGLSSRECIESIEELGGIVVAASCLIDRSNGTADIGVPLIPLARLEVPTYKADNLPAELAALTVEKPGSRNLKT